METIVKYRFDKEMVSFVKKLDIKTSMFGYDKNDVYSKFKDLLVKARSVCEELVIEEHRAVEQMKSELIEAVEDPAKLEELLAKWKSEARVLPTVSLVDERDVLEVPEDVVCEESLVEVIEIAPEGYVDSEPSIDEGDVVVSEPGEFDEGDVVVPVPGEEEKKVKADDGEEMEVSEKAQEAYDALLAEHEALIVQLTEMEAQCGELQLQLDVYKGREEELNRTADILREARLEGEAIVQSARTRAEQELFLYRAKRRDEEKAFTEVIKGMEARKEHLIEVCALYQNYIDEGQGLLDQLQEYASRFSSPTSLENNHPQVNDE